MVRNRSRALVATLIVLLTVTAAGAATSNESLRGAYTNYYEELEVSDFSFETGSCAGGAFDASEGGRGFTFYEGATFQPTPATEGDGFSRESCGDAVHEFALPYAEFDHIHARFMANRSISQFAVFAPVNALQELYLDGLDGAVDIFPPANPSVPATYIDLVTARPASTTGELRFVFHDEPPAAETSSTAGPVSGVEYRASVWDVQMEYSLLPATGVMVDTGSAPGTDLSLRTTSVSLEINATDLYEYDIGIQVQVAPELIFHHAVFPDGTESMLATTRTSDGPRGFDRSKILTETFADEYKQVVIPQEVVQQHGPGRYTLVFHEEAAVIPASVLIPMAFSVMAMPVATAGGAGFSLHRFSKEHVASMVPVVRGFRRTLIFALVIYALFLAAVFAFLGLRGMATLTLTVPSIIAYVVILGFVTGFAFLWILSDRYVLRATRLTKLEVEVRADALAQSNEDLSRFAQIASHDLKEPLRTVRNYTGLLERKFSKKLGPEGREYIEFASSGAKRMGFLLDGLVAYARIDRSGSKPKAVNLDMVLANVTKDLHVHIVEAGAKVSVEPLPTVLGDESHLHRLFLNLLGNAVKFREPDRPVVVRVSSKTHDGRARISVHDNGQGIEDRFVPYVFDMFFRRSREQVGAAGQGAGVGLAVCKRIVEQAGGEISVESIPGQGSTFHVDLPVLDERMK